VAYAPATPHKVGVPEMTGLYIKGCVNSEEVVFTVDTGVSVSLLAKYIYDC